MWEKPIGLMASPGAWSKVMHLQRTFTFREMPLPPERGLQPGLMTAPGGHQDPALGRTLQGAGHLLRTLLGHCHSYPLPSGQGPAVMAASTQPHCAISICLCRR